MTIVLLTTLCFCLVLFYAILHLILLSPLARIPGPRTFALTKWRLAYTSLLGHRTREIHSLHKTYGPVIRVAPSEIHFNSLSALRVIYGPGSSFGRTDFYRMFDVYGRRNLFTFHSGTEHAERKKLVAHAYSKSKILSGRGSRIVSEKVNDFLDLVGRGEGGEIFESLHWFSMDVITEFLYGRVAATSALRENQSDRALLGDILDPRRRLLSWFAVYLPRLTKWMYSRDGVMGALVKPLLPMKKPATYTGIRVHALKAMKDSKAQAKAGVRSSDTIIQRLYQAAADGPAQLDDMDIASEVADHFLAGIDTTSDTLMFLIWAISLPKNAQYQNRIIQEAKDVRDSDLDSFGSPTVEASDKLPYLDAVIKETLRLYAPLPASEPRSSSVDTVIDGYTIPAGTTVSTAPYSLHRNEDVFPNALKWDPERWLRDPSQVAEMKKWWWAFSSGVRMCIGMHLALAEMALVPAVYRKYRTRIKPGFEKVAPAITSRFEAFSDETFTKKLEHTCMIEFIEH